MVQNVLIFWLNEHFNGGYMKKLFQFFAIMTLATAIFSCQKGSSDSNSNMNTVCMQNPAACQGTIYQQGYGFQPYYGYNNQYYGYNNNYYTANSAYLCNCPAGSMPTYNTYGGLGCVSTNMMGGLYGYAYFGFGANNNHWVNIPQVSNHTGYNQSSCYNGVVQSCIVGQTNSCAVGYTCQSTSAQSRVGLCVSNNAINNTGNVYR